MSSLQQLGQPVGIPLMALTVNDDNLHKNPSFCDGILRNIIGQNRRKSKGCLEGPAFWDLNGILLAQSPADVRTMLMMVAMTYLQTLHPRPGGKPR